MKRIIGKVITVAVAIALVVSAMCISSSGLMKASDDEAAYAVSKETETVNEDVVLVAKNDSEDNTSAQKGTTQSTDKDITEETTTESTEKTTAAKNSNETAKDNNKEQTGKSVVVTITEHSDKVRYDGKIHILAGFDVSSSDGVYSEDDFEFEGEYMIAATDPGVYDMNLKPSDFKNKNSDYSDVTFKIVDGKLTIDAVYMVTIHYVYEDGSTAAVDKCENFVKGEKYTFKSPTIKGYKANYTTISSSSKGMPAMNLEYTVKYMKVTSDNGANNHKDNGTSDSNINGTTNNSLNNNLVNNQFDGIHNATSENTDSDAVIGDDGKLITIGDEKTPLAAGDKANKSKLSLHERIHSNYGICLWTLLAGIVLALIIVFGIMHIINQKNRKQNNLNQGNANSNSDGKTKGE